MASFRRVWRLLSWRPNVPPSYEERAVTRAIREVGALVTEHPWRYGVWSTICGAVGVELGGGPVSPVLGFLLGAIASFVLPWAWFFASAAVVQRNEARAALQVEAGAGNAFTVELSALDEIASDLDRLRNDLGKRDEKHVGNECNGLTDRANQILRRIDPVFADKFIRAKKGEDLDTHIKLCVRMLREYVDAQRHA